MSRINLDPIESMDLGPWDNRRWAEPRLRHSVDALPDIVEIYESLQKLSLREANTFLRTAEDTLKRADLHLGWSDEALANWSDARARQATRLRAKGPVGQVEALKLPIKYRFPLPRILKGMAPEVEIAAVLERLTCKRWWLRHARRAAAQEYDQLARRGQIVHRAAQIYCATSTLTRNQLRRHQNQVLLSTLEAVADDNGDRILLADAVNASVSNPRIRRTELMTRMRGFEERAKQRGDRAIFVTLTAPGCSHPRSGKHPNSRYNGATPRDAQGWLCTSWARVRSHFKRAGIAPYGFRVAEPHHDGTPHWHLLIWVSPGQVAATKRIIKQHWHRDPEPGSTKHRIRFEEIDPKKGSATGYMAKYVAKSVDGHGLESDLYGTPSEDATQRILAWASTWKIRQFQQIGGPPITTWRELRRFRTPEQWWPPLIKRAWAAADAGNWSEFCEFVGLITVWRGLPYDLATGELRHPPRKPTGEPTALRTIGILCDGFALQTRTRWWRVSPAGAACSSLDLCQ